jgi:hypothetical protein
MGGVALVIYATGRAHPVTDLGAQVGA